MTLRPGREHAWLDSFIEFVIRRSPNFVQNWFRGDAARRKSVGDEAAEKYFTQCRIERLGSGIISVFIMGLLVAPIYVLYHLTNDANRGPRTIAMCIVILMVSTLAFSAVASFFTKARRHEILGAAAAYCAVLVVFLGGVQVVYLKNPPG